MSAASEGGTPGKQFKEEETDHDNSDEELKIVIESPARKKRLKLEFDEDEKSIIESVEGSIEKCIEEKAAKTNLNVNNVKKLLKQVVTNEHVLALVKQYENPEENNDCLSVFEPKLTRAKAKELFSSPTPANLTNPVLPWTSSKPISEVQALISEDLQEDSSGDEYVPEESEDDRESTAYSETRNPPSVPSLPPTTPTKDTIGTQTAWTDDGMFRIPAIKEQEQQETESATIALRTRSKLSLSSTPLEEIEGAFMPPDITTGMYDMDCDDDDWKDFLKTFTKPLDEVTRAPDDEDHDPEYNILADEEIDLVDKDELREELREDRAVKISRKELSNLMKELVEFADIYESREIEQRLREQKAEEEQQTLLSSTVDLTQLDTTLESELQVDSDKQSDCSASESPSKRKYKAKEEIDECYNLITAEHIPLLEQQLRQHVQMLTQNYLLTFQHPTLSDRAPQIKEFLLNFKFLSENKDKSFFKTVNLEAALKLIENWEQKFQSNDGEAQEVVSHFQTTTTDAFQAKLSGRQYVLTFPEPLLRTIANSEVFLYPHLLPRIPFYSPNTFHPSHSYNAHENQLIAMGLEQFIPYLEKDKANRTKGNEVNLKCAAREIHRHVLGGVSTSEKVYLNILKLKNTKGEQNPVNYYFKHKQAPPTAHSVCPLSDFGILPPCRRPAQMLPYQWKNYIYKEVEQPAASPLVLQPAAQPTTLIQVVNVQASYPFIPGGHGQRLLLPKQPLPLIPITQTPRRKLWPGRRRKKNIVRSYYSILLQRKFAAIIKKAAPLEKLITVRHRLLDAEPAVSCRTCRSRGVADMLPSMPSLLMESSASLTEIRTGPGEFRCDQEMAIEKREPEVADRDADLLHNLSPFLNIGKRPSDIARSSVDVAKDMPSTSTGISDVVISQPRSSQEKDNMAEINAFMKASSKIRKEPSGAEKKRLRLKREFLNNLRMVTPAMQEDIDKNYESFALSYYKKLQEVLSQEDYRKVIEILVNVDVSRTDAVDIYNRIIQILQPKYKELAEEFLIFLNDVQALTVGKLVPYYMIKNMLLFLHKVDAYFQDKPSQAKRIYSILTELGNLEDITMDKLKSRILPLLKGNTYLVDLFLQNFVTEHPPESLIVDKFETIDITKELTNEEETFESIIIPNDDDQYGNSSCICECHNDSTDPEASIRKKHCIPCGTKYLHGKIFIQTGKGLRPATVRFLTSKTLKEQKQRLNESPTQSKKRTESASKRSSSPMKECHDESRVCKKKEDEGGGKKKTRAKSPKKVTKKVVKPKPCKKTPTVRQKSSTNSCDKKADNLGVNSVNKLSRLSRTKTSKDSPNNKATKSKRGGEKTAASSADKPAGAQCEKASARLKEKVARASEKVIRSAERTTGIREKLSSPSSKGSSPTDKISSPSSKSNSPNDAVGSPSPKASSYSSKTSSPNTKSGSSSSSMSTSSPSTKSGSPSEKTSSPSEKTSSPTEQISSSSEHVSSPTEHISPTDNISSPGVLEIPLKSSGACSQKRCAEEPLEFDLNTSAESVIDLKLDSAESESEFCEESSQANTASDAEDSSSSSVVFEEIVDTDEVTIISDTAWTREEDKTILETFRKESNKDNVFQVISKCLPNRTIYQIKSRFQELMALIQQMTSEAEGT